MLQIKITNKSDLLKALNSTGIKKIHTKEITDQDDLMTFNNYIKKFMSSSGALTLIAVKE